MNRRNEIVHSYTLGERIGVSHVDKVEDFIPQTAKEEQALSYILTKHEGQMRRDGSMYVTHLVAVASIVRNLGIDDDEVICAALLHDVVEDTATTLAELEELFGARVARLVDGVSKFKTHDGMESDFETLRKVAQRSYVEPEVGLIKLADRLHNMRTLDSMPPDRQVAKARETLMVYTRLAESYGLWVIKTELEDLAFKYIDPDQYQHVKEQIDSDPRLTEEYIRNKVSILNRVLRDLGINGRVVPRLKGYYEANKKRNRAARRGLVTSSDFRDLTDIVSFRVVLADEQSEPFSHVKLTTLIGMVEREVYDAFDNEVEQAGYEDSLTVKQLNGYQALHVAIKTNHGPFEVAMMSEQMEGFNNWGLAWLLANGERHISPYILKVVFTVNGSMRFVPKNATLWEVAYLISPNLGARTIGAKIHVRDNDTDEVDTYQITPTEEVPNGAQVEVITGDGTNCAPDPVALDYVSPATRLIIEKQLRMADRNRNIETGREIVAREVLTRRGLLTLEDLKVLEPRIHSILLNNLGVGSQNELYSGIGAGHFSVREVNAELDKLGVTKEQRGWSTLVFRGRNHVGVLSQLTKFISELGIDVRVTHNSMDPGDRYTIDLVVQRMSEESRMLLEARLKEATNCVDTWEIY